MTEARRVLLNIHGDLTGIRPFSNQFIPRQYLVNILSISDRVSVPFAVEHLANAATSIVREHFACFVVSPNEDERGALRIPIGLTPIHYVYPKVAQFRFGLFDFLPAIQSGLSHLKMDGVPVSHTTFTAITRVTAIPT
ncbi:MAG: hypothetical protein AAGI03_03095 [Pseudomonadota bacterium]